MESEVILKAVSKFAGLGGFEVPEGRVMAPYLFVLGEWNLAVSCYVHLNLD